MTQPQPVKMVILCECEEHNWDTFLCIPGMGDFCPLVAEPIPYLVPVCALVPGCQLPDCKNFETVGIRDQQILVFNFCFLCMTVLPAHICTVPTEARRERQTLELELQEVVTWGPLQEQPVFVTAEPALQLLFGFPPQPSERLPHSAPPPLPVVLCFISFLWCKSQLETPFRKHGDTGRDDCDRTVILKLAQATEQSPASKEGAEIAQSVVSALQDTEFQSTAITEEAHCTDRLLQSRSGDSGNTQENPRGSLASRAESVIPVFSKRPHLRIRWGLREPVSWRPDVHTRDHQRRHG